jgi:hypothetical protein
MAARLGNVLYWLGCAIAVVFGLVFFVALLSGVPGHEVHDGYGLSLTVYGWRALYAGLAVGGWLVGRASRYILAGT